MVSILVKIRFGHAQISVPKIGITMLKTASINPGDNDTPEVNVTPVYIAFCTCDAFENRINDKS